MMLGTVAGTVASTIRTPSLAGQTLVRVVVAAGHAEHTVVACNPLSAGPGDRVVIAHGAAARHALKLPGAAIDATVIAIVDPDKS
ncbi:EutN/CcmL family microcompartment protein [Tsukamurella soli]|uniref:Ethanolamine utilization protein EutN n=1 Tax=Tsukamurella soli TaxID=644556 RepID=A0ABP8J9Q2_9ACTN